MVAVSSYVLPGVVVLILVWGMTHRVPLFSAFLEGAKEGLAVCLRIAPSLVALMCCIGVLRESGLLSAFEQVLAPIVSLVGFPQELCSLALLRPLSGSGALALVQSMMQQYGPDTFLGLCACVMMASTETTFYTIAVYFGAVGVRKTRYCLLAALTADAASAFLSVLFVRIFLG